MEKVKWMNFDACLTHLPQWSTRHSESLTTTVGTLALQNISLVVHKKGKPIYGIFRRHVRFTDETTPQRVWLGRWAGVAVLDVTNVVFFLWPGGVWRKWIKNLHKIGRVQKVFLLFVFNINPAGFEKFHAISTFFSPFLYACTSRARIHQSA